MNRNKASRKASSGAGRGRRPARRPRPGGVPASGQTAHAAAVRAPGPRGCGARDRQHGTGCPPLLHHYFSGDHALGGTRHSKEGLERWFERLFGLFPGLDFEVKKVLVRGWPWRTVAMVEWVDRARPADGVPYVNEGTHVLRFKWGRLAGLHAYLDTQKVEETLDRLAKEGLEEASAPPILT